MSMQEEEIDSGAAEEQKGEISTGENQTQS